MIYLFVFMVSFMTVFLITPSVRYVALKLLVIDRTNSRKIHSKVVTKLGGISIYIGFLGGLVTIFIFSSSFFDPYMFQIRGLIICSSLILLLGIYDDFQGSNAYTKFAVQIVVSLLLIKAGFRLEKIYIPGLININLGWLSNCITLLWLVGITNAVNLIDGLDGLATGIQTIAFSCLFLYGIIFKNGLILFVSLSLVGACLAFLRYNFYPAKIFLGDTGSLFLGFIVGSLAIYPYGAKDIANPFFCPIAVVLLIPIIDTFYAIIRRTLKRQNIFKGDSSHLHHHYIKQGFTHPEAVKRLYFMTIFLGIASFAIIYAYKYF